MVSHLFFYQLALIALVWLFFLLLYAWPSDRTRRHGCGRRKASSAERASLSAHNRFCISLKYARLVIV